MKRWQIYSKTTGRIYTCERAVTATGALDKYAQRNGFGNWKLWSDYLRLDSDFTVLADVNKILVS